MSRHEGCERALRRRSQVSQEIDGWIDLIGTIRDVYGRDRE
jgi:hypothetical protein